MVLTKQLKHNIVSTGGNYTARNGDMVFINGVMSSPVITLPANPYVGNYVTIVCNNMNFSINRNGNLINGRSVNLSMERKYNTGITLVFTQSGWRILDFQRKGSAIFIPNFNFSWALPLSVPATIPLFMVTEFIDSQNILRLNDSNVLLRGGRKYYLMGSVRFEGMESLGTWARCCFWDITNNIQLGTTSMNQNMNYNISFSEVPSFSAFVNPINDITIEVRRNDGDLNNLNAWDVGTRVSILEM